MGELSTDAWRAKLATNESREEQDALLKRFFGSYLPDDLPPGRPLAELVAGFPEAVPSAIEKSGDILADALDASAPSFFQEYRGMLAGFTQRLQTEWCTPLDLLERCLLVSVEAGREFLTELRSEHPSGIGHLHTALVGLHARGCQVANEILVLLSHGYADGAHARWRTLHELAVVALFVSEHGDEMAERYLCHQYVEAYKEARIYAEHAESLGLAPLRDEEVAWLEGKNVQLCSRFGKGFDQDYGWATEALAPLKPTLASIRRSTDLAHLGPQYALACQNVHGAAKALFFRLGVPGKIQPFPITLAGPSNTGLADPGAETAQAVFQLTCCLLAGKDATFERLVILRALTKITREAQRAFFEVHQKLERGTGILDEAQGAVGSDL